MDRITPLIIPSNSHKIEIRTRQKHLLRKRYTISEVVKISAALYAKTSGFVVIYVHAAEKERRLIISIRK